jgi:ferredoxin
VLPLKVYLDKDTCISCGLCPSICPRVFEMQDDGKAGICNHVIEAAGKNEVPEDEVDSVREAEEACPVDAISTK